MLEKFRKTFSIRSMRKKVLIVASLLATIPVLVMGTTAYLIASDNMIREINAANQQTMLQIQQRIDEKLITLENITLQNSTNPTFTHFLSLSNPLDDIEAFGLTMTILSSMQVLIDDVDSVYLYRPDKGLVVSPDLGMTDDRVLPDYVKEALSKEPSKIWLDHQLESHAYRDGLHQITFIRKMNTHGHSSAGYLIVNLDETTLFRIFSNMNLGDNRELLIITPSSNIFSDLSKNVLEEPFEEYSFIRSIMENSLTEDMSTVMVDGLRMSLSYVQSPHNGWKYVTIVPFSDMTQHLQQIKQTTFAICLLLVFISATASGLLSKRWLYALQSLMESIKKKSGLPEAQNGQNEFVLIRSYFESLEQNNEQLERQIGESMPILKNNFIQKLFTEPYRDDMKKQAAYYEIPGKYDYYSVICIELDNMRGHTEEDSNLFHYAVMNIAKEIVSRHGDGIVVQIHSGHIALLLNHKEQNPSEDQQTNVFHMAENIRNIAESLLHITVTMGIGHSYEGLHQVRKSFREAMEALDYQLVQGSGKVLYIGQVKLEGCSLNYPYECEHQIMTNLKFANLVKIQDLLDDFAHALKSQAANYDQVRQSFMQLLAATQRSMLELDASSAAIHNYNLYQRLFELNTTDKIVHWLKSEVYPPMTEHIRSRLEQRTHSTIQKALDYIQEYYDSDLSMPMVADVISMPVSHFSHMFKMEVGMTFSDYVIALRMEKARQMLENTDTRISEIAEKLRYNNPQNFIRVFKKMNGMTPGEYRSRRTKIAGTGG
ncbi:helix-turn-helix domain-containing protein [Marinicrinis lubricantis]|uniref:Helix-turn-helix domain-containing protein n=1 Tax=Marinicrinis lubricantis TaxID=2086470 RepID=A0ABW1IJA2_9BACL